MGLVCVCVHMYICEMIQSSLHKLNTSGDAPQDKCILVYCGTKLGGQKLDHLEWL